MVAKGFLAAAILVCCSTTFGGDDSQEKCSTGDCPLKCAATSAEDGKQPCKTAASACTKGECEVEGQCDQASGQCCDDEKVALEHCSTEKCTATKGSGEKRCATKCSKSTGDCSLARCAKTDGAEKCATRCDEKGQCVAGKCKQVAADLTATLVDACGSLKCAVVGTELDDCVVAECQEPSCGGGQCKLACQEESCSEDGDEAPLDSLTCLTDLCKKLNCAFEAKLTATGGKLTVTVCKSQPGKCAKEACSQGSCPTEKCAAKTCTQQTCSTGDCSPERAADAAADCAATVCSKLVKVAAKCGGSPCGSTADCDALQTKLAELRRLQDEIAQLRGASGTPEQLMINVKVVEVDMTRCRELGFSFDVASPHVVAELNQTMAKSADFLTSLEKNNLAKVVANPTLVTLSGRPTSFHAGGEFPVTSADGTTEFKSYGTKVDVLATAIGDGKVQLEIRPEVTEVQGECGPAPCPALQTRRWDAGLVTELGTPCVLSSAVEERTQAKIEDGGRNHPHDRNVTEEVREIQHFAVVTVNSAEAPTKKPATIRHAGFDETYEQELVSRVTDPEFITRVYPVPDLQVWKVRPGGVEFDADLLVAHLKATVAPQSWRGAVCSDPAQGEQADGEIQPFERNGSLVICQTEKNHERIATLLQEMRRAGSAKEGIRDEAEVVPASVEEPISESAKCRQGSCSKSNCGATAGETGKCSKDACSKAKCGQSKCSKPPQQAGNSLELGERSLDVPLTPGIAPPEVRIDVSLIDDSMGTRCTQGEADSCPCIGGATLR
jgi:hypothetical protein